MFQKTVFLTFVVVKAKFYDRFVEAFVSLYWTASAQLLLQPFCLLQHYFLL